ncbi:MAG: gfo/Idh/MocA family oxidoreductase [Planctomyces sp.]|nr:gfo/Idh/MocA family oxidoreductase [Planctomyces sp.]
MSTLDRRDVLKWLGSAAATGGMGLVQSSQAAANEGDACGKTAPPRIKIGQIGVGHAHADKLAVYRNSPDYEVVGIVEPNEQLRRSAQSKAVYRDLPWMTQDELLSLPGLEAVLVETEVRDLLSATEACIAAGKHVHLDKPAGDSLSHYRRILEAAEKQRLLVQMGYMFRYSPAVILLREFLANGWLGEIFEVHAVMSKVLDPATRKQLGEYPGGIMFELGCHVIDLVLGILPDPDKITPFARKTASGDDRLIDNMLAVFEYPRATAAVRSTGIEVEGFARRHLTVCCTRGTFHIQPLDSPAVRLSLSAPITDSASGRSYKKGVQEITLPKFPRYVGDAADMAHIIRGEKASDFSYAHDLAVQSAVLQASGVPLT